VSSHWYRKWRNGFSNPPTPSCSKAAFDARNHSQIGGSSHSGSLNFRLISYPQWITAGSKGWRVQIPLVVRLIRNKIRARFGLAHHVVGPQLLPRWRVPYQARKGTANQRCIWTSNTSIRNHWRAGQGTGRLVASRISPPWPRLSVYRRHATGSILSVLSNARP